mmetsp:Transcript_19002/g.39803  ORF Transcript_19002/g.39803 Transcript_19002/m.39803 type:complete len:453 (-) Transcript_19002:63-1421(-)
MGKRKSKPSKSKSKSRSKPTKTKSPGFGFDRNLTPDWSGKKRNHDPNRLARAHPPNPGNGIAKQHGTKNGSKNHNKNGSNHKNHHDDERRDFERRANSLAERSRALEMRVRSRSGRNRRGRSAPTPQAAAATATATATAQMTMALTMKPASFNPVQSKSTNQLMEETMHQIGRIMSNTTNSNSNNNNTNINNNNNNTNSGDDNGAAAPSQPSETPENSNNDNSNNNPGRDGGVGPRSESADKKTPSSPREKAKDTKQDDDNDDDDDEDPLASITADTKTNGDPSARASSAKTMLRNPPLWDPISTVQAIVSDIDDNDSNKAAPRSRFVTRMIPIHATCFASPEELRLTCVEVLKRYIPNDDTNTNTNTNTATTKKTFAIRFKRRNCSGLDRTTTIQIVGDIMQELFPECTVDLNTPDATILVETCGTLCGISVIDKHVKDHRNFNLMGGVLG